MRPSAMTDGGSGGALNNVDVTFDYIFEAPTDAYAITKGDRVGEPFRPLKLVLRLLVDGASAPSTRKITIGHADDYGTISEDGRTLSLGARSVSRTSELGGFIQSLFDAGMRDEDLPEDVTMLTFEPLIGRRMRVVQVPVLKKDGTPKTHDGNSTDRMTGKTTKRTFADTSTRVSKLYDGVPYKPPTTSATTSDTTNIPKAAEDALKAVLDKKGGSIAKAKLRMALLTLGSSPPVIAYLENDENLRRIDGVIYEKDEISMIPF